MSDHRRPREHPRTADRRRDLLRAARDCFAEHGVDATSLRQIAARAGMTHTGLLHHFGSKEELVLAVLQERDREEERSAARPGRPESDPADRSPFLALVLEEHRRAPEITRLWAELAAAAARPGHPARELLAERYARARELVAAQLRRRAADGALRDDAVPEVVAMLLPAVLDGLQTQWLLQRDLRIDAALDHFLGLVLRPGHGLEDGRTSGADPDRSVRSRTGGGTRSAVIGAAAGLFAARGYDGTSVQDVADAAGCSKATVLYHFAGKGELLAATMGPIVAGLDRIADRLRELPADRRRQEGVPALVQLAVRHRALAASASAPAWAAPRGRPEPTGTAEAVSRLCELLADPSDVTSTPVVRFALVGVFAFCRDAAGLDDRALAAALHGSLARLLPIAGGGEAGTATAVGR